MDRDIIIDIIGQQYKTKTMSSEEGEFFYNKEFKALGKDWNKIKIEKSDDPGHYWDKLDIRFVDEKNKVSVCVETKMDYKQNIEKAKEQLNAYMSYEKQYSSNLVIGVIASTINNDIVMYRDSITEENKLPFEEIISMKELIRYLFPSIKNDKQKVLTATWELNELLHSYGIEEKIRSQFVGTCLLALKNGLIYETTMDGKNFYPITAETVLTDIKTKLEKLLTNSMNKAEKITLLYQNVLQNERVKNLSDTMLHEILTKIKNEIVPSIDDETTAGQDILNLFFTMFNKYVDKDDKNQAFTPDHITDFMCKITEVNRNSIVLDPCCGSGSFLVRALVTERNDCNTLKDKEDLIDEINKKHIYGIEFAEKPFGLATTNMLIHGDGNTNIIKGNCFDESSKKFIQKAKPTVILMNPPYNAQYIGFPKKIVDEVKVVLNKKGEPSKDKDGSIKKVEILKSYCSEAWNKKDGKPVKEDPTNGLSFVEYISDVLHEVNITNVKLAVLLPLSCAIGTSNSILVRVRENLLKYNTLDAVFSLPNDIFYPGAAVNSCCMLFTMGQSHFKEIKSEEGKIIKVPRKKTFFGYYKDDGFRKSKNLGRIEEYDSEGKSIWETKIYPKWLELFQNNEEEIGLSAKAFVNHTDEWLCEAYMKTDYSKLTEIDFKWTLNNYLAYLVKEGCVYES